MQLERTAKLFRNGSNQAIRIPREFEFPGNEVRLYQDAGRLIIEPKKPKSLLDCLAEMEPLDEEFPDVDEGLLPLDDPSEYFA